MTATSEQLWSTVYTLGSDDSEPLQPAAIARLAELGIVEWCDGRPRLTPRGEKCFIVMESGDGEVPELDDAS